MKIALYMSVFKFFTCIRLYNAADREQHSVLITKFCVLLFCRVSIRYELGYIMLYPCYGALLTEFDMYLLFSSIIKIPSASIANIANSFCEQQHSV